MKLKQQISSLELLPSSGGCFEVTVNGKKLHSKLESRQFPDAEALLKAIRSLR